MSERQAVPPGGLIAPTSVGHDIADARVQDGGALVVLRLETPTGTFVVFLSHEHARGLARDLLAHAGLEIATAVPPGPGGS